MIYGRVHDLSVRLHYDGDDDDAKPQTNQVILKQKKQGLQLLLAEEIKVNFLLSLEASHRGQIQ